MARKNPVAFHNSVMDQTVISHKAEDV